MRRNAPECAGMRRIRPHGAAYARSQGLAAVRTSMRPLRLCLCAFAIARSGSDGQFEALPIRVRTCSQPLGRAPIPPLRLCLCAFAMARSRSDVRRFGRCSSAYARSQVLAADRTCADSAAAALTMRVRSPGVFWGFLGPPGCLLGASWGLWGLLCLLGASWGLPGPPGTFRGLLVGPPVASWASWAVNGASWAPPGSSRAPPGAFRSIPGPPGRLLGPSGRRGGLVGPSGRSLGRPGGFSGPHWGHLWPAGAFCTEPCVGALEICMLRAAV